MTATARRIKEVQAEIANLKKLAALRRERERLRERIADLRPPPSLARILDLVSRDFDVPIDLITGPSRQEWIVIPRHVAMYLTREIDTDEGLESIGLAFGGRNHGTVINAIRRVKDRMDIDDDFARRVADLILQCVPTPNLAPIIDGQKTNNLNEQTKPT